MTFLLLFSQGWTKKPVFAHYVISSSELKVSAAVLGFSSTRNRLVSPTNRLIYERT